MARQEDRRAATRSAVLDAAQQMFGANGYALTSVDDVAAKAGVAKGAIYHHFPTKASLFEAVVEAVSARVLADVIEATSGVTEFWKIVETGSQGFFKACADPATVKILLHDGPLVLGWTKWRQIDQRNFGGLIRQVFSVAIENRILAPHDPEKITRIVLGAVTEAAIDSADSDNFAVSSTHYVTIISAMIAGWALKN